MKNGNHEKEGHPNDPRKKKFYDRALSCGNHTFLPYDCPVILQRGGEGGGRGLHYIFWERGDAQT